MSLPSLKAPAPPQPQVMSQGSQPAHTPVLRAGQPRCADVGAALHEQHLGAVAAHEFERGEDAGRAGADDDHIEMGACSVHGGKVGEVEARAEGGSLVGMIPAGRTHDKCGASRRTGAGPAKAPAVAERSGGSYGDADARKRITAVRGGTGAVALGATLLVACGGGGIGVHRRSRRRRQTGTTSRRGSASGGREPRRQRDHRLRVGLHRRRHLHDRRAASIRRTRTRKASWARAARSRDAEGRRRPAPRPDRAPTPAAGRRRPRTRSRTSR